MHPQPSNRAIKLHTNRSNDMRESLLVLLIGTAICRALFKNNVVNMWSGDYHWLFSSENTKASRHSCETKWFLRSDPWRLWMHTSQAYAHLDDSVQVVYAVHHVTSDPSFCSQNRQPGRSKICHALRGQETSRVWSGFSFQELYTLSWPKICHAMPCMLRHSNCVGSLWGRGTLGFKT